MARNPKCKSATHVDVVTATGGGDPPGVWTCTYVAHGSCRNVAGYSAEIYVLTRNGKLGMQMLPDLAKVMPARLRDASRQAPSVRIRHNVAKLKTTYATLTRAAAEELAGLIEANL